MTIVTEKMVKCGVCGKQAGLGTFLWRIHKEGNALCRHQHSWVQQVQIGKSINSSANKVPYHRWTIASYTNLTLQNEFLDLENIDLPQITWIWSWLTPEWQVFSISWIFNLQTITSLSGAKLFTHQAFHVDTSYHERKSEIYPFISIFFTHL